MHDTVIEPDETEVSATQSEEETPVAEPPFVPSAGVLIQLAERPVDAFGLEDPISLQEPSTPPYAIVWIVGENLKKYRTATRRSISCDGICLETATS